MIENSWPVELYEIDEVTYRVNHSKETVDCYSDMRDDWHTAALTYRHFVVHVDEEELRAALGCSFTVADQCWDDVPRNWYKALSKPNICKPSDVLTLFGDGSEIPSETP